LLDFNNLAGSGNRAHIAPKAHQGRAFDLGDPVQDAPDFIGLVTSLCQAQGAGFFVVAGQSFWVYHEIEEVIPMALVTFQVEAHKPVTIDLFTGQQWAVIVVGDAADLDPAQVDVQLHTFTGSHGLAHGLGQVAVGIGAGLN
jgi:hypothetical protein